MPIVHGMAQEYGSRLTVVRVNIHNKDTAALQEQYGFMATPEFYLVDADGNILGCWDDSVTLASLKETIERALIVPLQ